MRYLIISDIHGNWDALRSVLARVRRKRFDAILVLGDLVGYGAAPNRVLIELAKWPGPMTLVRGNHDKVIAGLADYEEFSDVARVAAEWTRDRLTAKHREYLRDLPAGPLVVEPGSDGDRPEVAICHGSPANEDAYLLTELEVRAAFEAPPRARVTFFGHTHLPSLFSLGLEGDRGDGVDGGDGVEGVLLTGRKGRLELSADRRYLINPGSVGQPRDRDPRAALMIYDSQQRVLSWRRVRYGIRRAQRRILSAGLPDVLAKRLAFGL